MHIRKAI